MKLPSIRPYSVLRALALGVVVFASGFAATLPAAAAPLTASIETEVILLFVPLCLLMLGLVAEAARQALLGAPRATVPARPRRIDLGVEG